MNTKNITRVAFAALILCNIMAAMLAVSKTGFTSTSTAAALLTCVVIGLGVKGITVNKYIVLENDKKDVGGPVRKQTIDDAKYKRIVFVTLIIMVLLTSVNVFMYVKAGRPPALGPTQEQQQEQSVTVNVNTTDNENALDLNVATREELEALPGVGKVLAERIILQRPYYSVEELKRVEGIGDVKFMKVRGRVKVGGTS